MEWLRLYCDMPNDPKVGTLSDTQFRTWVELLCLAGKADAGGCTGVTLAEASWALRRDIAADLTELGGQRGLITIINNRVVITKWEKRQYKSDSSTERTRKWREKHSETSQERHGDGAEQRREETDTEKKKSKKFIPPTIEEVDAYCKERGNGVDVKKWHAHYTANGWKVGKNPMKNWRAAVITWEGGTAAGGERKKSPMRSAIDGMKGVKDVGQTYGGKDDPGTGAVVLTPDANGRYSHGGG
jgi:hypothetical protein